MNAHSQDAQKPAPGTPTPARGETRGRKRRPANASLPILVRGVLAAAVILGVRAGALSRLESDLRRQADRLLEATVQAKVSEVRAWAERQKQLARTFMDNPSLVSDIAALKRIAEETNGNKEKLLASPPYRPIVDAMTKAPSQIGEVSFAVVSPSGMYLCSGTEDIVGRVVTTSGGSYLRRCLLGEWIVTRPYPDRQFTQGVSPDYARPVMSLSGPVYDKDGKLLAVATFRFNPHREFYKLLSPGNPKLIAFDEKSLVLNDFGEKDLLHQHGLLPELAPGESGLLRLHLRDPGGDLRTGFRPETSAELWPSTVMSLQPPEAAPGMRSAAYRDVLGRRVQGAWTWLPEWEMGLGAEQEEEQILAPARAVNIAFLLILAIPVTYTTALLLGLRPLRTWLGGRPESPFGSYVLERSIGKGGMAEVFLARHDVLKRPAAVKILSNPRPEGATVTRFEREARLACRLSHPNTIQIFDYGETPDGRLYYAMEYLKGLNLSQLLSLDRKLPVARAVFLLQQVAGSLEEAHSLGMVHRDLKPSNIMVCEKGGLYEVVKVLDFGIATANSASSEDFTRSVEVLGTPANLAPERIRMPQTIDPRSDIYAFGTVAFHLLTGRNVFEGPGPTELIYQVMSADRPSPSQLRGEPLPPVLEKLILDCLEINPEKRPAGFRQVIEILDTVELPERWSHDKSRAWWEENRERVSAFTL